MPELPEVEVLVRHLDPLLRGARIRDVVVHRPRVVRPHSIADLKGALLGERFERVERRGKFLLFRLRGKGRGEARLLIGHLGMTGRMFVQARQLGLPKHSAVALDLGTKTLVFEDTRYFGRFSLDARILSKLGPEPLSVEFSTAGFAQALRRSSQAIKIKLLDQTLVAGVGNIYASEALFRARVSPRRAANRLRGDEIARLHGAIRDVLNEAIERGATLPLDFAEGSDGLFYYGADREKSSGSDHERLLVYDRAGSPCFVCQTPIRQLVQAARSTYFCPRCQRTAR